MATSFPVTVRHLSRHFARKIQRGEWKPGERIPTETELMEHYQASQYTIRAALKSMENRGWMKAVPGSGRKVTRDVTSHPLRIGFLVRGDTIVTGGQGLLTHIGINSALVKHGHNLLTFTINNELSALTEKNSGMEIEKAELDGIIVHALQYKLENIQEFSQNLPTVVLSRDASSVNVPSFFIDHGYNAAMAVVELFRRGHKRVAMLDAECHYKTQLTMDLRRGFRLGLQLAGASSDAGVLCPASNLLGQNAGVLQWLHTNAPDVTAVISYYTAPLEDLYKAAQATGPALRSGFEAICLADLSADLPIARRWPDFDCPFNQMGHDAVECLIQMISGHEPTQFSHTYFGQFRGFTK